MEKIKRPLYKNISLIGFMGSGKSTVGKILAERLKFLFIDTDNIIEIAKNRKISDIFGQESEETFRDIESEVIEKIYRNNTRCVLSCGGGVILRKKNMNIIKKNSFVVYLHISSEKAYQRLKNTKDRPLLGNGNRREVINKLINKRKRLYTKYADITIENNEKSPDILVDEIIKGM